MKKAEKLQFEITEIEKEIDELNAEVSAKKADVRKIKLELWTLKSGFQIGDEIVFYERKAGEVRGRITSVDLRWSEPYPEVTLYKKDGTLGSRTRSWGLENLRKV